MTTATWFEVTAYDSSGVATPMATVTINVVDEDEKPTFGVVTDSLSSCERYGSGSCREHSGNGFELRVLHGYGPGRRER